MEAIVHARPDHIDEPQNVGTFTIVGVVRDARWQSFQFRLPPRPMFYVPLAQKVNYVNSVMTRVEYQSHFISGLMLVTKLGPGGCDHPPVPAFPICYARRMRWLSPRAW